MSRLSQELPPHRTPDLSYEVIVVGAGPSGALAAYLLARGGRRVALIDKAKFPRPKICGDCLNPRVNSLWRRHGLEERYLALPHVALQGLALEVAGRTIMRQPLRQAPRAISREVLDAWLVEEAQAAGADFFPETVVDSLDTAQGRIGTSIGLFKGSFVVGADGRNSTVARLAGLAAPVRRCPRVAWQTTVSAPPSLDDYIHMDLVPGGYYGLARINEKEANLCAVFDSRSVHDPVPALSRYVPHIALPKNLKEWRKINPISRAPATLGNGRIWLVGDAARVVEPFTGEGIAFALFAGELASQHLLQALHEGQSPATQLKRYARAHARLYRSRETINRLMGALLRHPKQAQDLLRAAGQLLPGTLRWTSRRVHRA